MSLARRRSQEGGTEMGLVEAVFRIFDQRWQVHEGGPIRFAVQAKALNKTLILARLFRAPACCGFAD